MDSLRKLSQLPDFKVAALPATSIFEKLNKLDPHLQDRLFDAAIKAQKERHFQPQYEEELEAFLEKKPRWQQVLKNKLEDMGLGFIFKSKAADKAPPPPERLERRMDQPPPDRITIPLSFTKERMMKDDFTLDVMLMGDDLRHAINTYLEEQKPKLTLSAEERASLQPKFG